MNLKVHLYCLTTIALAVLLIGGVGWVMAYHPYIAGWAGIAFIIAICYGLLYEAMSEGT